MSLHKLKCQCGDDYYVAFATEEDAQQRTAQDVASEYPSCAPCSFPQINQTLRVVHIDYIAGRVGVTVNAHEDDNTPRVYLRLPRKHPLPKGLRDD